MGKNFVEKKISSETIYKGKILDLEVDKVKCPNDNVTTREVIRHCKAVCVLAEYENEFILERQYRYPYNEVLWELPAGKVDPGEDLVHAALRELEEETGFHANSITYLGKMYPSCAYTDEEIYLYYASDLVKTHTNLDPNEIIDVYFKPLDEINEMVINNVIVDAKSICALHLYMLNIKK